MLSARIGFILKLYPRSSKKAVDSSKHIWVLGKTVSERKPLEERHQRALISPAEVTCTSLKTCGGSGREGGVKIAV